MPGGNESFVVPVGEFLPSFSFERPFGSGVDRDERVFVREGEGNGGVADSESGWIGSNVECIC